METENKTLNYYLSLPYTAEIKRTEQGWFAKMPELSGCTTWADTFEELGPMIEDKATWIAGSLEVGLPVPKPGESAEGFSGKVNLRMRRICTEIWFDGPKRRACP